MTICRSIYKRDRHLIKLNCFYSLGSKQTVNPSELYVVYRTHLHLAARFYCFASSQTGHPSEPYAVYRTRLHLAARFFCSSSLQQLIELNCMPFMQLKPKLCLMHPSLQTFYTFLTVFIHHCLRLLHRT